MLGGTQSFMKIFEKVRKTKYTRTACWWQKPNFFFSKKLINFPPKKSFASRVEFLSKSPTCVRVYRGQCKKQPALRSSRKPWQPRACVVGRTVQKQATLRLNAGLVQWECRNPCYKPTVTHSMGQSPSWETNWVSASQELCYVEVLRDKVPCTLRWPCTEGTWLYCDYFIWCVSCNVIVSTCFVMCGCVYVWVFW